MSDYYFSEATAALGISVRQAMRLGYDQKDGRVDVGLLIQRKQAAASV
jgi:hypothetical protein